MLAPTCSSSGCPYSDPLADGATLQHASSVALRSGATFERSLELLARIHRARPKVPLVPMAYVNQAVGRDDPEAALRRLAEAGASGLILADLTIDEGAEIEAAARAADLALVYLVAPTTAPERRTAIAARSGGYLYAVSFVGVTGARRSLPQGVGAFLRDVRARSPIPVAAGFGVSRPAHVRQLGRVVDGVIVGSALVDALGDGGDVARMADLVKRLAGAADEAPSLAPRTRSATVRVRTIPRERLLPMAPGDTARLYHRLSSYSYVRSRTTSIRRAQDQSDRARAGDRALVVRVTRTVGGGTAPPPRAR